MSADRQDVVLAVWPQLTGGQGTDHLINIQQVDVVVLSGHYTPPLLLPRVGVVNEDLK